MKHDVLEHELTSCAFTLNNEIFVVVNKNLSQSEKLEDIARLLNKI